MKRLLLLLPLLFIPLQAKAVNSPLYGWPSMCSPITYSSSSTTTEYCYLYNVTAGNTVVVFVTGVATAMTVTGTESLTCPGAGTIVNGSSISEVCYVHLASNHSQFQITATMTAGFGATVNTTAWQIQGFGTFDVASSAAGTSTSITTAGTNEQILVLCADHGSGSGATANGGQTQIHLASSQGTAQPNTFSTITEAAAGTYSVGCTFTGTVHMTVAIAFPISSPPAPPAINAVQTCIQGSQNNCPLLNVKSGNVVVIWAGGLANSTATPTLGGSCTSSSPAGATCTCPAGAQANVTNTDGYVIGICYSILGSNYGTFNANIGTSGTGNTTQFTIAAEVTGLTSYDSGSAAAANAQTVNYTTAAANEFTACFAEDFGAFTSGNTLVPGNSFNEAMYSWTPLTNSQQAIAMYKTTAGSGSNTCSYTITTGNKPLISTISFGASVTAATQIGAFIVGP